MVLNQNGYEIIDLPTSPPDLVESYGNLHFDEYMGDNRFRRFAQFRMFHDGHRWEFERLPHRPYVTFSKYNPVAGGIRRHYKPIIADFTTMIRAGADNIPLDTGTDWQVNVHQLRIKAGPGLTGTVVPEGPHSDGRDYVMIAVVNRHLVTGAEMTLMPSGGGEPFYRGEVAAGKAALLADREMFHDVSEIEPLDKRGGHRDTMIATWVPWSEKWYGEDFEEQALDAPG